MYPFHLFNFSNKRKTNCQINVMPNGTTNSDSDAKQILSVTFLNIKSYTRLNSNKKYNEFLKYGQALTN